MTHSRRESRSSLGNVQNDALFEFETFKKKFLLANKHITKLNSTLSVRIEELNSQISMLYVENLRLRASEIALASQLKREREQSRKILTDAEAASHNLTKHLNYLLESLHPKGDTAAPLTPPSPRARRPPMILDPVSPQFRISRPPNIPGIFEEEEPSSSSAGELGAIKPSRRKSKAPRLSVSKLPLPTRAPSPTPPLTGEPKRKRIDLSNVDVTIKSRKTIRRQSGLLKVNTEGLAPPRSCSPAFGSPIRLEAGLAEAEEEAAVFRRELDKQVVEEDQDLIIVPTKERKKGKTKEPRENEERDALRERRKAKEIEESSLKSKSSRNALQPIDNNVEECTEIDTKPTAQRQFLRPPSPPQDPSSPNPEQAEETNAREKRVRKSVNYTEPKLNTKMRKPDPPADEPPRKKRSSSSARTSIHKPPSSTDMYYIVDEDAEATPQPQIPAIRRSTNEQINPEDFPMPPSRPGSAAAMYSPGPPCRSSGSTSSTKSTTTIATPSTAGTGTESRLHRIRLVSDEDTDGAEADSEYGKGEHPLTWPNVNVDSGRRRGVPKRSAATAAVAALEDIRRHSMAI